MDGHEDRGPTQAALTPFAASLYKWSAVFWAVMGVYAAVHWMIWGWSTSSGRILVIAAGSLLLCLASLNMESRKGTIYLIASLMTLVIGVAVVEFVLK